VGTRALAIFSCPKRLSGGPNKRQTAQRPSKNSGHQSGRGAIALNSNDKVEIRVRSTAGLTAPSNSDMFSFIDQNSFPTAFFEKDYYANKRLFPTSKSFANDENKNDCRVFRKPQLLKLAK
jgi:hypothetical protein